MTLNTKVYLHDAADRHEVFMECRRLLGCAPSVAFDDDKDWGDGESAMCNPCGIGLPAWLWLHYRDDGPRRPDREKCDPEICDEDCDGGWHDPAHWLEVSFDTAYSYSDAGGGAGALHAHLLFDLGQWLDERGIGWSWRNEFTGDVHGGDDRYGGLGELTTGGQAAMRWFKSVVEPVITGALQR